MDIKPIEGQLPEKLAEAAPRKSAHAPKPADVAPPKGGDSVEISDNAREAQKIAGWAQAVREMPEVRVEVVAEINTKLNEGRLLDRKTARAAAERMRKEKIVE